MVSRCPRYFRFTTEDRHSWQGSACLKGAKLGSAAYFSIGALMDKQATLEADPSRNDYSFAKLTALFDKVRIDLLCGDNICIAAGLVSV
jgi:hypothetical protein